MRSRNWRRLRAAAITTLLLVVALAAAYVWFTRPQRIRAIALAALRAELGPSVELHAARFSPRGVITLDDLVVLSADDAPPLVHVFRATIGCDLSELAVGRVQPRTIRVQAASVSIILASRPGAEAPDAGATAGPPVPPPALDQLLARLAGRSRPKLIVDRADVQVFVRREGRLWLQFRRVLGMDAREEGGVLAVRIDHVPPRDEPFATLTIDPGRGELHASSDWMPLATVRDWVGAVGVESSLPAALSGDVRASSVRATRAPSGRWRVRAAVLEAREPSHEFRVAARPPSSAPESVFRLTGLMGTASYDAPPDAGGELLVDLRGALDGAPAHLHARIAATALDGGLDADAIAGGVRHAWLRIDDWPMPNPRTHPALVAPGGAPPALAAALLDFQPDGRASLMIEIPDGAADARPPLERVRAVFEPRGASCRYGEFPYDFHDVHGRVCYDDGRILIERLRGKHGAATIDAEGVVNSVEQWCGFDLRFRATHVALDADLRSALPGDYRELWDAVELSGAAALDISLARPDGSPTRRAGPPLTTIVAQLASAGLNLGEHGRLEDASGGVRINAGRVTLEQLTGRLNDARVALDGVVEPSPAGPAYDLRFAAEGVAFRETACLADSGAAVELAGRANVSGAVSHRPPHEPAQQFDAALTSGRIAVCGAAESWTIVGGRLSCGADAWLLHCIEARRGDDRVELDGLYPRRGGAAVLALRVETQCAEALADALAPPEQRPFVERLGPSGPGDLALEWSSDADGRATARVSATVFRLAPRDLPEVLQDVAVAAQLVDGRLALDSLRARVRGSGRVELSGAAAVDGAAPAFRGHARLTDIPLAGASFWPGPSPVRAGVLDAQLDSIEVRSFDEDAVSLRGRVALRDAHLALGVDLTDASGALAGAAQLGGGAPQIDTVLQLQSGRILGQTIQSVRGALVLEAHDPRLRVDILSGALAGGAVRGALAIDTRNASYELGLNFENLALDALAPPPEDAPPQSPGGRVDGRVTLRGRGASIASRRGEGQLHIRDTTFLRLPLLARVFRAGWLRSDVRSGEIDRADLVFDCDGARLRFTRAEFLGRELRLVGSGEWRTDDDTVDLTLVGAHPREWPRLAMLTDLLERAGAEVLQFRVTGPRNDPDIRSEALFRLTQPLRDLLAPPPDE